MTGQCLQIIGCAIAWTFSYSLSVSSFSSIILPRVLPRPSTSCTQAVSSPPNRPFPLLRPDVYLSSTGSLPPLNLWLDVCTLLLLCLYSRFLGAYQGRFLDPRRTALKWSARIRMVQPTIGFVRSFVCGYVMVVVVLLVPEVMASPPVFVLSDLLRAIEFTAWIYFFGVYNTAPYVCAKHACTGQNRHRKTGKRATERTRVLRRQQCENSTRETQWVQWTHRNSGFVCNWSSAFRS